MMDRNEIERIKAQTDIVSLIGQRIPLKRSGKSYRGTCPICSRKALEVLPSKQTWKCWHCDKKGGDVIAYLTQAEGMKFQEALEYLSRK